MANDAIKKKRLTFLSMLVTLGSFIYKVVLASLTSSIVLFVASASTLMVFISKFAFVKNVTKTREKKKKAYLIMTLAAFIYSIIFILFVVLKINGIDASNQKTYEGYIGAIFIGIMILLTILSIIKLKDALNKSDLLMIGLKEMTFISALSDIVIILEYVTRTVSEYKEIPELIKANEYAPLAMGVLMLITSIAMLRRHSRYEIN